MNPDDWRTRCKDCGAPVAWAMIDGSPRCFNADAAPAPSMKGALVTTHRCGVPSLDRAPQGERPLPFGEATDANR